MRTDEMLKGEELAAENEQLRVDLADWQASSEAYRLDAEKLQADLGEWKQAAGIEAGLRREFLAENERLRAALKPFADVAANIEHEHPGWYHRSFMFTEPRVKMAWLIDARQALEQKASDI